MSNVWQIHVLVIVIVIVVTDMVVVMPYSVPVNVNLRVLVILPEFVVVNLMEQEHADAISSDVIL